jgi:hypothetical protein
VSKLPLHTAGKIAGVPAGQTRYTDGPYRVFAGISMAVYGQYETVAELSRTLTTTVSRARPADGGWDLGFDALGSDANYVLKAFHLRFVQDAAGDEAQHFLDRANAQQRAVALGARH